jgi:trigger factor
MKISKNQIDDLNLKLTVEINNSDYQEALHKRLNEYKHKADIRGFRRGMAPLSLIQRLYGEQALYETVNSTLSKALDDFVETEGLAATIVGEPLPAEEQPQISWKAGEDFTFIFDIAHTSEVNFTVSKEDKITYYEIEVEADALKAEKARMLEQYGSMQEGEAAGEKDYIIADIEGSGHKAEGVYVSVANVSEAARSMFVGLKAGESVEVNVNEAFENETDRASMLKLDKAKLAEMDPMFKFTVVNVKTFVPAVSEQATWDKMFGEGVVDSEEKFEDMVKANLTAQYARESNYRFGIDARKYFVEKANLQVPEDFMKRWIIYANEGKFTQEQVDAEFPSFIEDFRWQQARTAIMKQFDLKVTEADIREAAENYVRYQYAMYGMSNVPDDLVKGAAGNVMNDENQRRQLREQCADNKALAAVHENVTAKPKKIKLAKFRELK